MDKSSQKLNNNEQQREASESSTEGGQSGEQPGTNPSDIYNPADYADVSAYDPALYLLDFSASMEGDERSKVSIDIPESGSATPKWQNADQILVYTSNGTYATYQYSNVKGQFVLAAGSDPLPAGDTYYAYYPASICTGLKTAGNPKSVSIDLTKDTLYGGLGTAAGTSRAVSLSDCMAPMACCFTGRTASFKNAGHILVAHLYGLETLTQFTVNCDGAFLSGTGTMGVESAGAAPTMEAGGSVVSSLTVTPETPIELNATNPTNFFFIIPQNSSAGTFEFKTKFTQTDPTGSTFTPTLVQSASLAPSRSAAHHVLVHAHYFSGGKGTSDQPYLISNLNDLKQLQTLCSENVSDEVSGYVSTLSTPRSYFSSDIYYQQTADIDTKGELGVIGSDSRPLYFSYTSNVTGSNKLKISNFAVSENATYVGLFAKLSKLSGTDPAGKISNIEMYLPDVTNTSTSTTASAGALVGCLDGGAEIEYCNVTGIYSGTKATVEGARAGGLVGYVSSGDVSYCNARDIQITANGSDIVNADNNYCGGVVGRMDAGHIKKAQVGGESGKPRNDEVSGTDNVGGICGIFGTSGTALMDEDCYVSGVSVSGTGNNVGGAVGYNKSYGSIKNGNLSAFISNTVGSVNVRGVSNVGGAVGLNEGTMAGYDQGSGFNFVYGGAKGYTTEITATGNNAGGVVGKSTGLLEDLYTRTVTVTAANYAGGVVGYLEYAGDCIDLVSYNCIVKAQNSSGQWGNYAGGVAGYTASGSNINDGTDNSGSSLVVDYAAHWNNVEGNDYVGGVIGRNDGWFKATYQTKTGSSSGVAGVNVTAHGKYAGGVSGYSAGSINGNGLSCTGSQTDGKNNYTICAYGGYAGGIVGYSEGTSTAAIAIQNARVAMYNIYCKDGSGNFADCCGGIAGKMEYSNYTGPNSTSGTVKDCEIKGRARVGGVAGEMSNSTIEARAEASAVPATINGNVTIEGTTNSVGGIVGYMTVGTVTTAAVGTTSGSITVKGLSQVGGIVGYMYPGNSSISRDKVDVNNCVVRSDVSVSTTTGSDCGGIVGQCRGGQVSYCNSAATVHSGNYQAGGIAGSLVPQYVNVLVRDCKASGNVKTDTYSAGGITGRVISAASYKQTVIINCVFSPLKDEFSTKAKLESSQGRIGGICGIIYDESTATSWPHIYIVNCLAVTYRTIAGTNGTAGNGVGGILGWARYHNLHIVACICPNMATWYSIDGKFVTTTDAAADTHYDKIPGFHSIVGKYMYSTHPAAKEIAYVHGRFSAIDGTNTGNNITYVGHAYETGKGYCGMNEYTSGTTTKVKYYTATGTTVENDKTVKELMTAGVAYYNANKASSYSGGAAAWSATNPLVISGTTYNVICPAITAPSVPLTR